jgi:hypothetical protein
MPKLLLCPIALPLVCLLVGWCAMKAVPALAVENAHGLDAKVASIVPTEGEDRWLTVPWHTSIMQARVEAQNLSRPLFLWIMNGNPMGCT